MELASGRPPTVVAPRSDYQGHVPTRALLGGGSSELPPLSVLQPILHLGACSTERFPWQILLGGSNKGLAPGVFPKVTPPRRTHRGCHLAGDLLLVWLFGAFPRGPLLLSILQVLVQWSASPGRGSSEPPPLVSLHGMLPKVTPPRRIHCGLHSFEELPRLAPRSLLRVLLRRIFS